MSPRVRAYIYLTIVSLIWGIAAVVIKLTLKGISPLPFLTYRFAISAVIGMFFVILERRMFLKLIKNRKALLIAIVYSLFVTTFALGVLFLGLTQTTVLHLSLMDLVAPLLIGVFGVVFLKEHFTKREKIGAAVAIVGAFLTIAAPILITRHIGFSLFGDTLLFLYILFDSISIVFLKKLMREGFSAIFMVNFSFIVGFLSLIPIALFKYGATDLTKIVITLPLPYQLGVIFMAVVSGSIAFYLRGLGQKTIEVSEAGLFGYLISVFAAPLAIIVLGEKITATFIVGSIIVVIGILIAETKKRRV